ncbi:MAG TPA: FlgD immunoglobulin-like domain containing protein [Candidatus Marinimicrobia bacterium]|nr:FlgD immunoglobulin-like domain containing protein [Candidatus Neomarinimicrobiota bacterium]HRS50881.1 FlgD immunoglobulin-like domain containing protein [Candidatus Neomarinimicrobiota bacterium]HRU91777.1 FlgD immunoglobulin-like domain containing protein [Candidatus Neomarinimicrobiota bacterium]
MEKNSDQVGSIIRDTSNLPPNPPYDPSPVRQQIRRPDGYLEWTMGEDPDDDKIFYCEIIIRNELEPERVITVPLNDSLLEKAREGSVAGLSYEYNGRVRFSLDLINEKNFFRDGWIYSWEVRISDQWGGVAKSNWPEATFLFDDGINQPPLPPVDGFSPDGAIVATHYPEIKWSSATDPDVADRLRYEVVLSRDRSFGSRTYILLKSAYDQNHILVRTPLLENCQYFWRVRSIDLAETHSAWSKCNTFWVNQINEAPQRPVRIISPKNLEVITSDSYFWWLPSEDPDPGDQLQYQIECSEYPNFTEPLFYYRIPQAITAKETEPNLALPARAIGVRLNNIPTIGLLKDNTLYYWRIQAFDQSGISGTSASRPVRVAFNYQNDPPLPVVKDFYPPNNVIIKTLRPEIRWAASSDPDFGDFQTTLTYQIEISKDPNFPENASSVYTTEPGQTAFIPPENLTENDRWFYRIRACDQHGSFSLWSPTNSFITNAINEAPYPVTEGFLPKDSAVVETTQPLISWLPSDDPDPNQDERDLYYLVRFYEADNPKKVSQIASKPGLTSIHLPELKEDKYYYYQISAVDPDGNRSEWSRPVCFGVNAIDLPPDRFAMLSPFNGQDSVALDAGFTWKIAHDKDPGSRINYTLYYGTDSLFTTNFREIVIEQPEKDSIIVYNPPEHLGYATRYFWKVVATDNRGNQRWASQSNSRPFVFTTIGLQRPVTGVFQNFRLHQNYPNPFNVETLIRYDVPFFGPVDVSIYDLIGMKVTTLATGNHTAGSYSVYWNGTDQNGALVANGVYICRLNAPGYSTHIKVVLMR